MKLGYAVVCGGSAEANKSGKKKSQEATGKNGGLTKALQRIATRRSKFW